MAFIYTAAPYVGVLTVLLSVSLQSLSTAYAFKAFPKLSRFHAGHNTGSSRLHLNRLEYTQVPFDLISSHSGSGDAARRNTHNRQIMTLSRFMIEATRANPDHADLESLVESIQLACKTISRILQRHGVHDLTGNNQDIGESLYEQANEVLKNSLRFTGKIGVASAPQEEHPILIEEAWNSNYVTVFDPLDGSNNVDAGIVTGTIFGIFKEDSECLEDFGESLGDESTAKLLKVLQPSENMVAAGYCMYSSSTTLMLSLGDGVHGFTLDPNIGEFILTHPNVRIPTRGRIYSFNEARAPWWPEGLQQYVAAIKSGKGASQTTYTSRYIGSMIGDIHRTLLYGGIFGYPGDSKSAPLGKLQLVHEVAPMAFLIEQAGGKASTGYGPVLQVYPKTLHEHVPAIMGSLEDVEEAEAFLQRFNGSSDDSSSSISGNGSSKQSSSGVNK